MPIEPWWETNPATTPRQELGMVSPELTRPSDFEKAVSTTYLTATCYGDVRKDGCEVPPQPRLTLGPSHRPSTALLVLQHHVRQLSMTQVIIFQEFKSFLRISIRTWLMDQNPCETSHFLAIGVLTQRWSTSSNRNLAGLVRAEELVSPTRDEAGRGRDLTDRQPRLMGFDGGPEPLPLGPFQTFRAEAEPGTNKGDVLNCCGKMPSLWRAGLPGSFNLPKQLGMSLSATSPVCGEPVCLDRSTYPNNYECPLRTVTGQFN